MREIKFRAWEKSYKRMSKVTEIKWKKEHLYHQIFTQAIVNNKRIDDSYTYDSSGVSNGIVLMQYTGLKDKHGVEIYEGDVLVFDGDRFVILWDEERGGFLLDYWQFDERYDLSEFWPTSEVIGNIYDNPELIGGKI